MLQLLADPYCHRPLPPGERLCALSVSESHDAERPGPLVLLVDDFEDARIIYDMYLTHRGYHVRTASSGAECIAIAQAHTPAVILLDIRMPSMTGIETVRVLRADPRLSRVPVVALTAYAMEDERRELLDFGFDQVIAKPCLPNDLATALDRILEAQN